MNRRSLPSARLWTLLGAALFVFVLVARLPAQQWVTETRDPKQTQDEDFAKAYKEWTGEARFGSPLVDHLPRVQGVPTPKDVLGYHIGAPRKLTYYADSLKFYRALAAATPRVKVETIGKSDENRELVVVWVSSDANIKNLQQNRDNLAKLADPRGLNDAQVRQLIATTKPHYHFIGGLHSGETGPSEMLMELVYRLATETSPFISQIRDNVVVSVTPVADADGRDRNVDKFYCDQELAAQGGGGTCTLPYWGKYVYHDNNRDINLSQMQMRAIADWYFTAHPPIMHDLHESLPLLYTYSGAAPQNPNLDPLLFAELPWFSNWELAQMTKWGMPGVYTHAFMDGWSPGYLGSIAYNHNGMMRMYETQRGSDGAPAAAGEAGQRGGGQRGGRGGRGGVPTSTTTPPPATPPDSAEGRGAGAGAEPPPQGRAGGGPGPGGIGPGRGGGVPTGRGGVPTSTTTPPPATPPDSAEGRGAGAEPPPQGRAGGGPGPGGIGPGRGGGVPTGRGGAQEREWYRGIPVPAGMPANFTRRNNTNYMQTGVLSGLQLTAMFPNVVLENFYTKTRNSLEAGRTQPPYGYVIVAQKDLTRPAELVRILRVQGIEVGQTTSQIKIGDESFPAGSYVIKGGQPYWRLAKNLLERQQFPDAALRTYDDSGWTMGLAFNVEVKEIRDRAILDVSAPLIKSDKVTGKVTGTGTAGLAVAHYGSNNMITFRYKLRKVPMKVAELPFKAEGIDFPAGSFIVTGSSGDVQSARAAVEALGLTAAALTAAPAVPTHDADAPRVAIYSNWTGTQELGWYRHAFDQFGIPYDLIYKERVKKGNLSADYDVIVMAAQSITRTSVLSPPASRPSPYVKSDKFKFLGMYGESPDTSGGFGQEGVDAIAKFLENGGTLITTLGAVRFPIEFGFARSVDMDQIAGLNAQKPLVQAEIERADHPVFYGYGNKIFPIKFGQGQSVFRVGVADQGNVLARFVGGDAAVLSGLMVGGDAIRQRPFAVDIPHAHMGKGRVIMFANNPVYRWQNHGEFNMVFNSILNWNDLVVKR